jgi:predicted TIM-barrel fold metal-dependent hydrolase
MNIIDSHFHLWDRARFSYEWLKSAPVLDRSFGLEDYYAASEGMGVSGGIFVECHADSEHRLAEACFVQALTERHPFIKAIVAGVQPEADDFCEQLKALKPLTKVKGVRRILHLETDELWKSQCFVRNIRQLADYDYTFDLCVLAHQLPLARRLVGECPDVVFVLDHCGGPDIRNHECRSWEVAISELASLPNVVCKVSGLVNCADPGTWKTDDLQFCVEHVITQFGWDRLLWGGDWPVCTMVSGFNRWYQAAALLTNAASLSEREAFWGGNAERIYRCK